MQFTRKRSQRMAQEGDDYFRARFDEFRKIRYKAEKRRSFNGIERSRERWYSNSLSHRLTPAVRAEAIASHGLGKRAIDILAHKGAFFWIFSTYSGYEFLTIFVPW
jgi:hypothetical protein